LDNLTDIGKIGILKIGCFTQTSVIAATMTTYVITQHWNYDCTDVVAVIHEDLKRAIRVAKDTAKQGGDSIRILKWVDEELEDSFVWYKQRDKEITYTCTKKKMK
jgi:hypothetical protein